VVLPHFDWKRLICSLGSSNSWNHRTSSRSFFSLDQQGTTKEGGRTFAKTVRRELGQVKVMFSNSAPTLLASPKVGLYSVIGRRFS
jgi:hypothetical protein